MADVNVPVVAVDGPGGTGKGTVCSYLAAALGWHFLDSGALYRAVALAAVRAGINLADAPAVAALAAKLAISFPAESGRAAPPTLIDGADVSEAIRTEECGNAASQIAAYPAVRSAMLAQQRAFKRPPGLVADGRDMGTVVFPEAGLKVFLTASPEERARRRHKQLIGKGISDSLQRLSANIAERDARDEERTVSPMRPAPDAIVIDTTTLNEGEVKKRVSGLVRDHFPGRSEIGRL